MIIPKGREGSAREMANSLVKLGKLFKSPSQLVGGVMVASLNSIKIFCLN